MIPACNTNVSLSTVLSLKAAYSKLQKSFLFEEFLKDLEDCFIVHVDVRVVAISPEVPDSLSICIYRVWLSGHIAEALVVLVVKAKMMCYFILFLLRQLFG